MRGYRANVETRSLTRAICPFQYRWEVRIAALTRLAVVAGHFARIERLKEKLPAVEFHAMVAWCSRFRGISR